MISLMQLCSMKSIAAEKHKSSSAKIGIAVFVREILQIVKNSGRKGEHFKAKSVFAIQGSMEAFIMCLFEDANLCVLAFCRCTVVYKSILFAVFHNSFNSRSILLNFSSKGYVESETKSGSCSCKMVW